MKKTLKKQELVSKKFELACCNSFRTMRGRGYTCPEEDYQNNN